MVELHYLPDHDRFIPLALSTIGLYHLPYRQPTYTIIYQLTYTIHAWS